MDPSPLDFSQPGRYPLPGRFFPLSTARPSTPLQRDGQAERYRAAKVALRQLQPTRCDLRHAAFGLRAQAVVTDFLRAQLRGVFAAAEGWTLPQLVLEMQEDLVVCVRAEGESSQQARVAYSHVSFPSGWVPEHTLGLDFEQIHAAVPSHDHFTKAHEPNPNGRGGTRARLSQSLYPPKPLVRYLWTVTPDGHLDRHPLTPLRPLGGWDQASAAQLRVERQVILALGDCVSVFLIRVHVQPVPTLPPAQRAALHQAVAQMPPALAEYKGLLSERSRILSLI